VIGILFAYKQSMPDKDIEQSKEYHRKWKLDNPDKVAVYRKREQDKAKVKRAEARANRPPKPIKTTEEIEQEYNRKREYIRQWIKNNPDKVKSYSRTQSQRHKDRRRHYSKQWRKDNADKCKEVAKAWKESNLDKVKETQKRSYEKHKDKRIEVSKIWKSNNSDKVFKSYRRSWIKRKYGLSVDVYDLLVSRQQGLCAICNKEETAIIAGNIKLLAVDHDHATGNIRGLLCQSCNCLIGHSKDNISILREAIQYLSADPVCNRIDLKNVSSMYIRLSKYTSSEKTWRSHLKRDYGLTPDAYYTLELLQKGMCAICGSIDPLLSNSKTKRLSVDHNHSTDEIRGLLCDRCNFMVAYSRDDTTIIVNAIKYLEKEKHGDRTLL
jgi:hypothetical protein